MDIIKQIQKTILAKKLFRTNDRLLVCVSGGPDSVFLLQVLLKLRNELKLELSLAHVNHNLRGQESDKDENLVRQLSAVYQIPLFSKNVSTKKFARGKSLGIEDAARKLRYDFFLKVCNTQEIPKIITAHTKDDQVETVFMRILRGTGIRGLCGISDNSDFSGKRLIRPLLDINKKDIMQYLKTHKIKHRIDSSNLKTDFFRNKVRIDILPALEKINPQLKNNLFNLSKNTKEVESFLQGKTKKIFWRTVKKKSSTLILNKKKYLSLEYALAKVLLRKIIEQLSGDLNNIDFKHIQLLDNFIRADICSGKAIDLPRGIRVKKQRSNIVFYDLKADKQKKTVIRTYELDLKKDVFIKEIGAFFSGKEIKKTNNIKNNSKFIEYFDLEKIKFPLKIRTRRSGDIFFPLGAKGSKKLKKFFIDHKIEEDQKSLIPLVFSGSKIIWVVGLRISDLFKVTGNTKKILKLSFKKQG